MLLNAPKALQSLQIPFFLLVDRFLRFAQNFLKSNRRAFAPFQKNFEKIWEAFRPIAEKDEN
jgi:hypothetical protein